MQKDKTTLYMRDGTPIKISPRDYYWLRDYGWYKVGRGYAAATIGGKTIQMHRMIMSCPPGMQVDHINGDPLDNRRENLRLATQSQNMHNRRKNTRSTSQYKGVSLHKPTGKWLVHIKHEGVVRHVGLFADEEQAALAYDRRARELYGAFACVNFPEGNERAA